MNLSSRNLCREVYFLNARVDHLVEFNTEYGKISRELFYIVEMVAQHPGITQKQLIQLFKKEQTSLSRAIKKLTTMGLIEKTSDSNDLRATYLNVTKRGNQVIDDLEEEICKITSEVTDSLNQDEKNNFIRALNRLQYEEEKKLFE